MEERSAGAILYNDGTEGRRFLLLRYPAGHWDFPKGNIEKGETERVTVTREVREETSLDKIRILEGFRKKIEYFYRRDGKSVHKVVIFLLAETNKDGVKISLEHQDFGWYEYKEALRRVTYNNSKRILTDAQNYLDSKTGPGRENSGSFKD
jgi:8-oxo-dGTP pyrophosphatase MutT (NUDIX family)